MTLGALILDPKRRCNFVNWESTVKSHSKIVVETTCQPVLEDHDSRRLERKLRFLLATLVTKSFAFVFDCSGEIILPSIF